MSQVHEKGGCFQIIQFMATAAILTGIIIWGILKGF